ncbi:MAG: RsmE family RNA methyltransferase [Fimbriimonadales bacterium]
MDSKKPLPLRALPRVFVPGANPDAEIDLPQEELDKLRKVLRLSPGAQIAVLPNDGSLIRCELGPRCARPLEVVHPETEPALFLTLAQALPKGDKLDQIIRACTEIGVSRFVLFPSDRTIVRWDEKKTRDRLHRLGVIAREAAEVCFRTKLPIVEVAEGLAAVLTAEPEAVVLSEAEGAGGALIAKAKAMTIVVGPEGGWAERELKLIGTRGVTLGPRVLRVDHAGAAAAAILLLGL